MRRTHFTLEVHGVDWVERDEPPEKPRVTIDFEGPVSTLRNRLSGHDGELLAAGETDVAFRLQSDIDDGEATGVVSVTNRATGDYVLELNADAEDVLAFIRAARRYGEHADDDGEFGVVIRVEGDELVAYDKTTLLVYNPEGDLLRRHSLIPSGIEL